MYTKIASVKPFDQGAPHINAPSVYGASPMKEILYRIPATGKRPMKFTADLPEGLSIDVNGIIQGMCIEGDYEVQIVAENEFGSDKKRILFKIHEGCLCQTPLMGWTSWNAYKGNMNQEIILEAARNMLKTGLAEYGYQYVNIDSDWQGVYGGKYDAIQPNENFKNMKEICDEIHSMGLKAGIYSTPMMRAFGSRKTNPGCTRGERDNTAFGSHYGIGIEHCEQNNVDQWTEWGFDYLKYDWRPCDIKNAELMRQALKKSPRDFVYCITVDAKYADREYYANNCNSWRENHDSDDNWETLKELCFSGDRWLGYNSPGHFFDLDMLETGIWMGTEEEIGHWTTRKCLLTEDEQLLGYTARVIFPSPIQVSCELARLTDFDYSMLCNEEVIAVNQDSLCKGAYCICENKSTDKDHQLQKHIKIYEKELSDGQKAIDVFNLGNTIEEIGIEADEKVRDLWAKEDIFPEEGKVIMLLHPHTVRLVKK